ncbi:GalE UDP-glucose 4-epimerase [uncultured Caudovirales phage]|uniref:GalE UDP-glucose 4-epimerase n=1 Tax=uncultured Caudovirales phage TaxID=2100421 RepID=A0A6J5TAI8_9CAUD|nr:GalE UDP-glucose 4-epimerase [uncultured Caudovirales phage]
MDKWVAITGCNGYIGGQTVLRFKDLGYKVIGIDRNNTSPWIRDIIDINVPGDFSNPMFVNMIIDKNPGALIHIAGTSLVGPSVSDPAPYYANNVGNTAKLLGAIAERGWRKTVVFSSSAAIYGNPVDTLITEESNKKPISPYGHSKLMAEQLLRDCATGYGFKTIALRYFNACGADSQVRHGQLKQATHLIARIIESIINNGVFTLNGTDYDTMDGTCIRDYLHVEDIANAHYLSTKYAEAMPTSSDEFNLGTGRGVSIRQIVESVERVTGKTVLIHNGPKREGDPAMLVASSYKAKQHLGWTADNSSIDNIVRTAWAWYNSAQYRNNA